MESEDIFRLEGPFEGGCYNASLASMRKEGVLCDVTIQTASQSFQAHRAVLAAASPFFTAMFTKNYVESRKEEVPLKDVDSQSVGHLIHFVYCNNVMIPSSNVINLLETAHYLLMDLVVDKCFEFLLRTVNPNNMLIIRHCAETAAKTDILRNADRYVRENFEDVSKCDEFKKLSLDTLKSFICRDDLFILTEEVVFDAVINWVKASDDRLDSLQELMCYVRMPLLTPEFLKSRLSSERLVEDSQVCEILFDVMHKSQDLSLTEKPYASYDLPARERFCKEKHHMKCLKMAGCGLYALCVDGVSSLFISYYDSINTNWAFLYNLPSKSFGSVRFVICMEESLYVLTGNRIGELNLETLDFTEIECNREIFSRAGIAFHRNVVYLFGGGDMLNEVQTLDLNNGASTQIGTLVVRRFNASVACLENSFFIIGGKLPFGLTLKSVEKFNLEIGESAQISPMLYSRNQCRCAALNGKIYVCNGEVRNCDEMRLMTSYHPEVYDPLTDQWALIREMNLRKDNVTLIPYNGKLQAFGNVADRNCFQAETYDPEKDEWKTEEVAFSNIEVCQITTAFYTNSACRTNFSFLQVLKAMKNELFISSKCLLK